MPLDKHIVPLCLLGIASFACVGDKNAHQDLSPSSSFLYVSTNGDDRWSGNLAEPNSQGTDGPFATLEQARDALRHLRKQKGLPVAATVLVRGGRYGLSKTLTLGPEDSGTPEHPLCFKAYGNERPVLTGSIEIKGFEPYQGEILQARLGGTALQGVPFRQLFFKGNRQTLARYPNFEPSNPIAGGYLYVADIAEKGTKGKFKYAAGNIPASVKPEQAEIVIFPGYNYWNNIIPVAAIDREQRVITLVKDASYTIRVGDRYYLQNLLEELDSPGEWYLDTREQTLYFWPPEGSAGPRVSAPAIKTLVEIRAEPGKGHPPEHIRFEGFAFEECDGTAIVLAGASHCSIGRSVISNTGGHGIYVDGGTENVIADNDISSTGAAAVRVSGGDRKTLSPSKHLVTNNHIWQTGVFNKFYAAIDCWGVGNAISHNLIHDVPRSGIFFEGNDHVIEYNHIHHVNQETQDSGIIHSFGRDWTKRGTAIRFNYLHHSGGFGRHRPDENWKTPFYSWGICLDDWTSGTSVYGNVIAHTHMAAVHTHGGRDNVIQNNIIIEGNLEQVRFQGKPTTDGMLPDMFSRITEAARRKYPELASIKDARTDATMSGNRFINNIIYYSGRDSILFNISGLDASTTQSDFNTVFHFRMPLIIPFAHAEVTKHWKAWQESGFDKNTAVADPLFRDLERSDFSLSPDSPALKIGFKEIPFEKIGLFNHSP